MPIRIEELPDEILLKVVVFARGHLKCLRFTSKRLHSLVTPSLFSCFRSRGPYFSSLQQCKEVTYNVSARKSTVFEHTRHLAIDMYIPRVSMPKEEIKAWFDMWAILPSAMPNLSRLTWILSISNYPPELANDFVKALGSHTKLGDIVLEVVRGGDTPIGLSLGPLHNLRAFSLTWDIPVPLWPVLIAEVASLLLRCPKLNSLSLGAQNGYWQVKSKTHPSEPYSEFVEQWSSLEEPMGLRSLVIRGLRVHSQDFLTHIPHFRCLEVLTIEYDLNVLSPEELGKIFAIFQTDNIHLRRISICSIHPPQIINYLLSYTGLEHFSIDSLDSRDDSPTVIDGFVAALKLHCNSLRSLTIDVNRISPWIDALWGLFFRSAGTFYMLRDLQSRVYISLEDVQANNTEHFWKLLDIAMRFPALRELRCDPITFKTGALRGELIITPDLIDPPNVKRTPIFMDKVIKNFIRERSPKFEIDFCTRF